MAYTLRFDPVLMDIQVLDLPEFPLRENAADLRMADQVEFHAPPDSRATSTGRRTRTLLSAIVAALDGA